MTLAEDFDTYFSDFAVTAVCGAFTAKVILDMPDEPVLGDRVRSRKYAVTLHTGDLGTLTFGTSMTVDGTAYRVLEVNSLDDGKLQQAILEKT